MSKSKGKRRKQKRKNNINTEIYGISITAFGLLSTISLFSFKMGLIGSLIRGTTFSLMGFAGYFFPIIIITIGISLIFNNKDIMEKKSLFSIFLIFLSFLIFLDGRNIPINNFKARMETAYSLSLVNKGGGLIGSLIGFFFYKLFGKVGGYLVLLFTTIIGVILLLNIEVKELISQMKQWGKDKSQKKRRTRVNKPKLGKSQITPTDPKDIKILDYAGDNKAETTANKVEEKDINQEIERTNSRAEDIEYDFPPITLLNSPSRKQDSNNKKEILNNAKMIEETMNNFGIEAMVTQINKGPTITCYELSPSPGIKLSRIVSLSDNIALSLASSDIRIEAPIPGKAAVGIEVPNKVKDNVYLKEIISSQEYKTIDSNTPLALGKDVSGKPIVSSIDKMPHLLIAGATGSGKSVCINTIIMSIIFKSSPGDVKLLLIDPKVVELSIYNEIPHLLIPVVTDAKKAAMALKWAIDEMDNRYKKFAKHNVRDIRAYNEKFASDKGEKMPTIVIIIDELSDLMMVAPQEIEDYICRLAQMARAAGIYLIVATQRPSVDVITGTIKANIPSRISFAVSSQVDSRTILDMAGAEKLLGKGDMLFYPSFYSKPIRVQGAFISDKEIDSVVKHLRKNNTTYYNEEVVEALENDTSISLSNSDELLPNAIELVVEEGQASISLLQRRLRIGYARAARIVDEMEAMGVVGGFEGSKPRKVLISKEDLEELNL